MSVGAVNKDTGARIPTAGMPAIDDALDLTSVNPVQNAIITAALANKQDKTDNSLQTTDKTVVGAVNELKSGLTNLDNEVNGDATVYPYADVITIEDAVPSNLADCSVKIEPVQDLHGYDKPWVGGAGKNKAPLDLDTIKTLNTTGTWSGNEYTINSGKVTVLVDSDNNITGFNFNGTFSAVSQFYLFNGTFPAGSYKITGGIGDGLAFGLRNNSGSTIWSNGVEKSYELSEDKENCDMRIAIGAVARDNVKVYPMIRLSTETDATFAPYTNICPISGHTQASVQRDGKNLFDESAVTNGKVIDFQTGMLVTHASYYTSDYIPVISGDKYTFSGVCLKTSGEQWWYDENKQPLQLANTNATKTVPNGAYYFRFSRSISDGYVGQIEKGETATPYVPYAGQTYTIALGDTIYGGTVDFDSGVMTVDRAIVDLGDFEWSYNNTNKNFNTINSGIPDAKSYSGYANAICSSYFINNVSGAYMINGGFKMQDGTVYVKDLRYDTVSDFSNAVSGVLICYELATPTTIQLTPQQIQLLKGTNTLTASTGQISVTANGVSGSIGAVQEQVNELAEEVAKVHSFTGTTSAYGVLSPSPSISIEDNFIIGAYGNGSYVVTPFVASSDNTWRFMVLQSNTMQPLAEQEATVHYVLVTSKA